MAGIASPFLFVLIALMLVGAWFLGNGVTGLVISQSCCSGISCPSEYYCDYNEPAVESPLQIRGWGGIAGGLLFIVVALFLWLNLHRIHR